MTVGLSRLSGFNERPSISIVLQYCSYLTMPASTSLNHTADMDKDEDIISKIQAINLDTDFPQNGSSLLRNKNSFKGKALPTGDKSITCGHKKRKSNPNKNANERSLKYTVKEVTINIGNTVGKDEIQEVDDFFPDDISDRLQLFDRIPHPPSRSGLKIRHSRTQSAKASFANTKNKSPEDLSKALVLKKRPSSAHALNATANETDKPLEPHIWKYDCKESPRKFQSTSDLTETVPEPYVFGYKSQRLLSGKRYCEIQDVKLEVKCEVPVTESSVPKSLRPFLPWQVHGDIPLHWTGVDPSTCLVLCPSLLYQVTDLPTVPPKQLPEEELDYIEKICPAVPPKKYPHPWNKLSLPKHKCTHVSSARLPMSAHVRIYSMDGQLLHETYQGNRTSEVVRKEIQELEDLMKGKGSHDGSLFVQYQAEITDMQNMLDRMCGRVEEIERREEERRRRAETPDYFGLKKFYKEHDAVISRIRQQHELCVVELAAMEGSLNLDSQHFTRQLSDSGQP